MNPVVETPDFSGLYLNPLDEMNFLIIAGFAIATVITLLRAIIDHQTRLANVHQLERLEQSVREVVRSNG